MPNRDVHVPVSAAAGAIAAGACSFDEPIAVIISRVIGGTVGGYIGGLMPDIIDSPRNGPNHRSIGHGLIPIGLICSLAFKAVIGFRERLKADAESVREDAPPQSLFLEAMIGVIDGFIAGYLAHLALDVGTPKGLPILA